MLSSVGYVWCNLLISNITTIAQLIRSILIQCDQRRPECGQCVRGRESCRGYRDEWDLVFRDQTARTIKRSKEQRAKGTTSPSTNNFLPIRHFTPDPNEIGVNYFLHNFVSGGNSPRGYFNYIPLIYHADREHPALVTSMAAVGLVALANSTQQPGLASHARAKYAEAICRVNTALTSPVESVKDGVLMAVISLGIFEHVSEHESWIRHVQGATALILARGKSQFSSSASIYMFNQVRADLILACMHSTKPFPQEMVELQKVATQYVDPSNTPWFLGVLGAQCANLLVDIWENHGGFSWSEYLEKAIILELDFQRTMEVLAAQEPYIITQDQSGDPSIIYNGRIDCYKDFWAIRVWNHTRSLRMILSEIMCYLLHKVLATETDPAVRAHLQLRFQDQLQTLSQLGNDFLATVPQASGYVGSTSTDCRSSADLSFQGGSVSGGYMLTWGLYMVGKCAITQKDTRKWIIQRLQHIGRDMHLSIAQHLLQDIMKIDQVADWCDDRCASTHFAL